MAFNDKISGFSQYNDSTYASETKMLSRLAELERKLADDTYNYEEELRHKRQAKRLNDLEKEFNVNVKLRKLEEKLQIKSAQLIAKKKAQLDPDSLENYKKKLKKKEQAEIESYKKILKKQAEAEKSAELKAQRQKVASGFFDGKKSISSRVGDLIQLQAEQGWGASIDALVSGIATLSKQLDSQINEIASYQSKINTRLQGSGKRWEGGFMGLGKGLSQTITGLVGFSPLIQQQKVVDNLNKLVEKGIAYNVEQRAFLETISEKIATTFDAANGTLLQLVRIQQSDTTAARLGMEGYLTRYLNKMFQTTEYLSDVSDTVSSSLYKATSLLSSTEGVGFEYQVQKWLGSLYSVGMSSTGVQAIAEALGMLGSGDISGLAGNQAMQNLLVMAANRSGGKSYAELLTQGLNDSEVNKLMKAMVEYLAEIADGTNNVIKSQYANIFGMSISDLKSIKNLTSSINEIANANLNYSGAMQELFSQAGQMYSRTSVGEMMKNVWANTKYSMSAGIAANPALYAIWTVANLLDDTVGGISIPYISAMGTGVDLETTVADIMRVGALSGGILNSLGAIIGAGSGGGFSPSLMLKSLGINTTGVSTLVRGTGIGALNSGTSISQSAYIGNASGEDTLAGTMAGAEDQKQAAMADAVSEEDKDIKLKDVNATAIKIYELLDSVVNGHASINTTVSDYGLIGGWNR